MVKTISETLFCSLSLSLRLRDLTKQTMQHQRPRKNRAILTEQQAIEIFGFRSTISMSMMVSSASFVAKRYGVNERTIRDIWKQRTWTHATCLLAEGAGPMAKRKMGRPVGSKDTCPRKQRLAAGTSFFYDSPTQSVPSKCDSKISFDGLTRPRPEYYERQSDPDQDQQVSASRRQRCSFLLLPAESSDEQAFLRDRPRIENERQEEASIDDQLHAWADRGPQWIISASLPLLGDSLWDCEPAIC